MSNKTKSKAVCHNMDILKGLSSEIKKLIIKNCIKTESDDYIGLRYMNLYVPRCKELYNQENRVVEQDKSWSLCNNRSGVEFVDSEEEKENQIPPKKKSKKEKVTATITNKVLELTDKIKGKIKKQGRHIAEQDSRKSLRKNRRNKAFVEYVDSKENEENWTPPKKKDKKKKSRALIPLLVPEFEPELPNEIKSKIGKLNNTNINWLITKRLFSSDVSKKLKRFSMPSNQIDISFLRDDEMRILDMRGGIEVGLVGPTGEMSRMILKKWTMNKPNGKFVVTYNLINGWYKDVVEANGLEIDQLVHVWSFREGLNLSFALVKVDESE